MTATASPDSASMNEPPRPIRFVVDGQPVAVDGVSPATTLLDWLRTHRRATGTKEGCAEGDCGACTVLLARRAPDGRLRTEPCNACIRALPTVDGCGVLTVEGLGGVHPAQRSMVACHGSQCGFCTPGFVMAMAARLSVGPVSTDAQANEALAGNLCRCTGYRPIVAAFHAASAAMSADAAARPEAAGLPGWVAALPAPPAGALRFEGGGATWVAPRTPEAVDTLLAARPDAWLLAGGTDIGLWVTKQLRTPDHWIWLGAVDALHGLEVGVDRFDIGAAVSLADAFAALDGDYPELGGYWSRFASPAIRAAGTLVGNLANGSPIGDAAPVLIALGASVVLRRAGDAGAVVRDLPLADLFVDYRVQRRQPGEWIERLRVPRRRPGQRVLAFKLSKRHEQDISAVSMGLSLLERDGRCSDVRLAFGGMAGIVKRAPAAEALLEGQIPARERFERAGETLPVDFRPLDDLRASSAYRLDAGAGLLIRAWHLLFAGGSGPVTVDAVTVDAPMQEDRQPIVRMPVGRDGAPR
jgi:xanthine dehydrogenase small subunit